ncbi:MAG: electron transfer flavoprotein subunit alpha/FixB family protein [Desulfobacula sp.]|jgi:electron transfer flavoprotein alpha subunit|uniref:electron transfer flavoprotein subunit alpha/FixB family protein n=1 Tax=Desulfobacula sp. TaxID=2593537 RepID=UPI001DC95AAF|nr:electron transfer flavoprotein subunit alpha/FixB family protein [Desulfobacula sp.]MBT3486606.1 electron transfer flavoprotein subunit alpha/FixB family protein [Desulfobacula sp.]MBT3805689.1 electron transfer flavoprotein subunit alpha/FixB family protein [Desulfobacula sp.]MBT4023883.1 electron transfer flavoprotein subunit alpha/FixB family protein [Desulfobacula sp.]MBT4198991.1 electron transfer flavoprotein subunit alpha/FixB family protein [Desulfobacula sp.]
MAKILVIADIKQGVLKGSTAELLSKAKAIGAETAVVAIGSNIESLTSDLAAAGSDTQYIADDVSLELFSAGPFASCVVDAANQFEADMIWFGFSETGKAVAPRVAAQLSCACATEITDVTLNDEQIEVIRPATANKVIQRIKVNTKQVVAVVRAGAFEADPDIIGTQNLVKLSAPAPDLKAVIKELISDASGEIDLADADIVISVGRGAKDQAGIDLVKELADDLAAGFGSSRAMVDGGLMAHNKQVGQTGKIVAPTLYMAIGISGAIQHLAGMNGSKTILAVNKDPEAPIFNVADYGIVGDLFEVVPILREEIKKLRNLG